MAVRLGMVFATPNIHFGGMVNDQSCLRFCVRRGGWSFEKTNCDLTKTKGKTWLRDSS